MSDLHLGHRNIIKYRPQFSTVEEHDNLIFNNLLNGVQKRDTLILLGDVCFNKAWWDRIPEVQAKKKILILGNHDTERTNIKDFIDHFDEIHSMYKHGRFWLSHAPIHDSELRGKLNIHGHTHTVKVGDPRYINVCVDCTDFKPVDISTINTVTPV